MTDYSSYSFWLETAGESLAPRAALDTSRVFDVVILGAGFSGLWSAYYLAQRRPDWRIAVVEKEIAGFGASGRCGGWCSPRFPVPPGSLIARFGVDRARALSLAMDATVDEIERVCGQEDIDAQFHRGGILGIARGAFQERGLKAAHEDWVRLGLAERHRLLSEAETKARVVVGDARGALFTPHAASLHPGRLVRGLARAVERRGVTIYEQTEVTGITGGRDAGLTTKAGELRARQAVILAGEAYLSRLAGLHRRLLPLYSLIGLTEPLSDAQWAAIGWSGGECLASRRYTVDYLTRTSDGRLLFGSRGAPYLFGSKISDAQDRHPETHAQIRERALDWFPALRGINFTHAWGGPVGIARDWMPAASFDADSKIGFLGGYVGVGVATTNLAARVVTDLVTGEQSALAALPIAQRNPPKWEIEPLRWLGVRYVQNALGRIDAALESGRRLPLDANLALRLERH